MTVTEVTAAVLVMSISDKSMLTLLLSRDIEQKRHVVEAKLAHLPGS